MLSPAATRQRIAGAIPFMSKDPSPQADSSPDAAAQDLVWMGLVKQGDTDALRELIETHQHRVIGTVAKMLGDDTDAEDIAQQVFIRVWKSAGRYEPTAKFTAPAQAASHALARRRGGGRPPHPNARPRHEGSGHFAPRQ